MTRFIGGTACVAVSAACLLLACDAPPPRDAFGRSASLGDLHLTCDAAFAERPATAATDRALSLQVDRAIPLPAEVARVADIVVSSDGADIYVLDIRNAQIARLDSSGRLQQVLGRPGQGPGDLSFTPMSSTATARMVLIDDSLLVAFDERSFKAYTREGRVRWDRAVSQFALAHRDGMHVSPARPGAVRFSESGKYRMRDTVRDNRTALELRTLDLSSLASTATARAKNNWVLLPAFTGFPRQQPYISEYKRAWDGTASRIAVYSYRRYGVCFFDDRGTLVSAFSRDIAPLAIDEAEQARAMQAEFGVNDVDARLPMLHRSAREMFADQWPAHAPLYTDIVLDPTGSVLVLRRVSAQRVLVDVFHESAGYVGTFEPPFGRLPLRSVAGRAIVADNEELVLLRYSWRSGEDGYRPSPSTAPAQGGAVAETAEACDEESPPADPFTDATPSAPALFVQFGSRDTTDRYESAVRVDRCGHARGIVRRSRTDGSVELYPLPAGYREALTGFDMSRDDRLIAYVEFDGEYGAHAVIRTFPAGVLLRRSRRLTVPGGDTVCGTAEFLDDSTWVAHVCADAPPFDRWVRLRGSLRASHIAEDTVEFGRAPAKPTSAPPSSDDTW